MDLYNKWFLRASGKRKFQPVTLDEKAAFAAYDIAKEKGWTNGLTEPERSKLMQEFHDQFQRTLS